ncbi:MAG: DUF1127 domain-containing protein [Boseongicola sp.]|nr:DUF1127 domain-containing protein [Boseongicola sp.]NNL17996.1 DUF1127 domain-containing protein [Boseongicola sp.]
MTDFACNYTQPANTGHPLFELSNKLTARIRARRQRKALATLKELDKHLLQDVGLTREDVSRTLARPLSVDATTELHRIAYLSSGRHM